MNEWIDKSIKTVEEMAILKVDSCGATAYVKVVNAGNSHYSQIGSLLGTSTTMNLTK